MWYLSRRNYSYVIGHYVRCRLKYLGYNCNSMIRLSTSLTVLLFVAVIDRPHLGLSYVYL